MTKLSPAAVSIWEAYENSPWEYDRGDLTACSAVLCAAADLVVPEETDLPPTAPDLEHFRQHERRSIRQRILAIADELEQC